MHSVHALPRTRQTQGLPLRIGGSYNSRASEPLRHTDRHKYIKRAAIADLIRCVRRPCRSPLAMDILEREHVMDDAVSSSSHPSSNASERLPDGLRFALFYADHGWRVFPLHYVLADQSCGMYAVTQEAAQPLEGGIRGNHGNHWCPAACRAERGDYHDYRYLRGCV